MGSMVGWETGILIFSRYRQNCGKAYIVLVAIDKSFDQLGTAEDDEYGDISKSGKPIPTSGYFVPQKPAV
jgi:hypothetical protein